VIETKELRIRKLFLIHHKLIEHTSG